MGKPRAGHAPSMLLAASSEPTVAGRVSLEAREPAALGASAAPADAGALSPPSLYDSHFSFVWRNLRRLGVPDALVEDAAQDVFLIVHRRWSSFDPGWSSVETWLFGIVLRVARNQRRSIQRRAVWLAPSDRADAVAKVPAADAGPADVLAQREAAALLDRLLDTLDEKRRAVLVLVDIEQMAIPQAAEALGINVNTAYWRLRTARKRLIRALAQAKAADARRQGGPTR